MHHRIIIKTKANDEAHAKQQVKEILEKTLRCPECEQSPRDINWDYVGEIEVLTKDVIQKNAERLRKEKQQYPNIFKMKTYFDWDSWEKNPETMEKDLIENRKKDMESLKKRLKEELSALLSASFMTEKEAPLWVHKNVDEYEGEERKSICFKRERAEEILKSGKGPKKKPQTPKEIADAYVETYATSSFSMMEYYQKGIQKLHEVISYGDSDEGLYTLHCTDNYYADMTEYTEGQKTFYVFGDRHH